MKQLNQLKRLWESNGFRVEVKDAPPDAVTFDTVIVFTDSNTIRSLYFYSLKEDKILGQF